MVSAESRDSLEFRLSRDIFSLHTCAFRQEKYKDDPKMVERYQAKYWAA